MENEVKKLFEDNFEIPEFDISLVSKEVLEKELEKHEMAYLEASIAAKVERKFLDDSVAAIEEMQSLDEHTLKTATKHLEKAKGNPQYFQQTKVDPSCYKALGHLQNIESKVQEVKTKIWGMEYHSGKIKEVREMLKLK